MDTRTSQLALFGGPPVRARPLPQRGNIGAEEYAAVSALFERAIREGSAPGYNGEEETRYCEEFAAFMGGFGPAPMLEDYPGLFWYGIHSAEMLFAFMGAGCRAVRCVSYPSMDLIIGEWQDGRLGMVRGTRFEGGNFGCVVHTDQGARCGIARSTPPYHVLLLNKVVEFSRTGVSPIDVRETLEIVRFLEAANADEYIRERPK